MRLSAFVLPRDIVQTHHHYDDYERIIARHDEARAVEEKKNRRPHRSFGVLVMLSNQTTFVSLLHFFHISTLD